MVSKIKLLILAESVNLTSENKIFIHKLLGFRVNSYLVGNKNNYILIDTGYRGSKSTILRSLKKLNICLEEIKYIVLTHTHFDHSFNTAYFKKHTGAKVIVHSSEADCLLKGRTKIPAGTNQYSKFTSFLGDKIFTIIKRIPSCEPEIIIDEKMQLEHNNLKITVFSTPGHSSGSLSITINDRYAFVGDTLFGVFKNDIFPPFADDTNEMMNSWNKLAKTECSVFYPGHGKTIKIDRLIKNIQVNISRNQ